jgi:hypothetical protein
MGPAIEEDGGTAPASVGSSSLLCLPMARKPNHTVGPATAPSPIPMRRSLGPPPPRRLPEGIDDTDFADSLGFRLRGTPLFVGTSEKGGKNR